MRTGPWVSFHAFHGPSALSASSTLSGCTTGTVPCCRSSSTRYLLNMSFLSISVRVVSHTKSAGSSEFPTSVCLEEGDASCLSSPGVGHLPEERVIGGEIVNPPGQLVTLRHDLDVRRHLPSRQSARVVLVVEVESTGTEFYIVPKLAIVPMRSSGSYIVPGEKRGTTKVVSCS